MSFKTRVVCVIIRCGKKQNIPCFCLICKGGHLWSFVGSLWLFAGGLWSFVGGLQLFTGGVWSFTGGFLLFAGSLWSLPV